MFYNLDCCSVIKWCNFQSLFFFLELPSGAMRFTSYSKLPVWARCLLGIGKVSCKIRSEFGVLPPKPLHGSGRARQPVLLAGGLLGWLGLVDKEEPDPLTDTVKRAVLAGREGDLVTADRLLHIALKMAHELQHEAAVTHILCLLGQLALERGLPGQAERLYTAVLQRLLQAGEPRHSNAVCEISLKLAGIFAGRGERSKAEQGYLVSACSAVQCEAQYSLSFQFCIEALKPRLAAADCDDDSLGPLIAFCLLEQWYGQRLT